MAPLHGTGAEAVGEGNSQNQNSLHANDREFLIYLNSVITL